MDYNEDAANLRHAMLQQVGIAGLLLEVSGKVGGKTDDFEERLVQLLSEMNENLGDAEDGGFAILSINSRLLDLVKELSEALWDATATVEEKQRKAEYQKSHHLERLFMD